MAKVTLLSNGHGEDAIGALLASELRRVRPDLRLRAYPTVGEGAAYQEIGLEVLGPRRKMPSGGLTLHSPALLWRDLRAGLLSMTLRQWCDLGRLETDLLVVVGDIYAQLLSALVKTRVRFVYQSLVSARLRKGLGWGSGLRLFMEVITPPERVLMRRLATRIYVRDSLTETFLKARGVPHVRALGNPALDALDGRPIEALAEDASVVALLPGSRGHTPVALTLMLEALALTPEFTGAVAWSGGGVPAAQGWGWEGSGGEEGLLGVYRRCEQRVWVFEGRFGDVLASAQLVLGTAGTGHEQAAALGLPVISFPVPPNHTLAFLANQHRLLGPALTLSPADPVAVAGHLERLSRDLAAYREAARAGPTRMGSRGGSAAIVRDLLEQAVALGALPLALR